MTWHRRLYAWARAHPGTVDHITAAAIFVVVMLAAGLTLTLNPFRGAELQTLAHLAVGVVLLWAYAERRRKPRRALWITIGISALQVIFLPDPNPASIIVPVIVFSATAYGTKVDTRWALVASLVGSVTATLRYTPAQFSTDRAVTTYVGVLLFHLLVCAVAWVAGDLMRMRRLSVAAFEERAKRLEQEREQERELAAADERRRIAREMHDVVAHSLSVIIAQADGARYAAQADPTVATATLGTISETGRGALREMRGLLGVLRAEGDDAAPTAPTPSLERLPELFETARSSGLSLSTTVIGDPARQLPAGAGLAAFRSVQESLTNVLKHAGPGATAAVEQTWTSRGLHLAVTDTGRGRTPSDGLGRGQQGMRERVELYGGTADFGPRPEGGYAVRVFLPYQEV